jgi:hypothetical protein
VLSTILENSGNQRKAVQKNNKIRPEKAFFVWKNRIRKKGADVFSSKVAVLVALA